VVAEADAIRRQSHRVLMELTLRISMHLDTGTAKPAQQALRCRYCVEEHSFLEMTPEPHGRFVCRRCGHVEQPNDPDFPCVCRRCVRAFLFSHHHRPRTQLAVRHEHLG
jgi:hypothetical protein